MNSGEAIKFVMKEAKINQVQLAKLTGQSSQSVISERLRRDNLSVRTMLEMLDAMGYEMVIQPKSRGKRKEGQIVLTAGEEKGR